MEIKKGYFKQIMLYMVSMRLLMGLFEFTAFTLAILTFVPFFADVNILIASALFTSARTMEDLGVTPNGMGVTSLTAYHLLLKKDFPLPVPIFGLTYFYFLHLSLYLTLLAYMSKIF